VGRAVGLSRAEIVVPPVAGAREDAVVTPWRPADFSLNGSSAPATGYRAPLMPLSAHGPSRWGPRGVRPGPLEAPVTQRRPMNAPTAFGRAHPTGGSTPGPGTTSSIEEVGQ
jgi:hypothetical protein